MARKGRNLASFDDVANNNIRKDINNNNNNNDHENVNKNDNNNINVIDNIESNINAKEDANMSTNENVQVNINENNKVNSDIKVNNNNNNNINENVVGGYLDTLIEGKVKKSESDKELTGIYIEKDLLQVLDRLAKKGGRGAKSRIVNEALRSVFKEKGLI